MRGKRIGGTIALALFDAPKRVFDVRGGVRCGKLRSGCASSRQKK
jgi:hypothetical protein